MRNEKGEGGARKGEGVAPASPSLFSGDGLKPSDKKRSLAARRERIRLGRITLPAEEAEARIALWCDMARALVSEC